MAFTKIQPQQLQLPTFTSPSGDFSFTDLSTGIQINLDREIGGAVNFTHGATVKTRPIITTASTNSIADDCFILGGSDNEVTGINNVIINGSSNTNVSGNFNTLLNGTQVNFGASGQQNTILAGKLAIFADQTTGAVILADHEGTATNSTNHSLLVSFASGTTFQEGDVEFNSHLKVDSSHSGIFSGNCNIGGTCDIVGAASFGDSVTLNDSGDAVSDLYIGSRTVKSSETPAAVTDKANTLTSQSDLKNILTGTDGGSIGSKDTFITGQIVTGASEAYLVFSSPTFTGCIPFSGLYSVI